MSNKLQERSQLQRFKDLRPDFPLGDIEETEEPDFLVHTTDGILGIELTRLFRENHKSLLKEQEELGLKIVKKAGELFSSRCDRRILVSVHFDERYKLSKSDLGPVAETIARTVLEDMETRKHGVLIENEENYEQWPRMLSRIHWMQNDAFPRNSWAPVNSGAVPDLKSEWVRETIEKKNQKCMTYRERCSNVWLVLIAEGGGLSSTFTISSEVADCQFEAEFDRVFLFQRFEGKVLELNLRKSH